MATLVDCLGAPTANAVAALRTDVAPWRQALARELAAPGGRAAPGGGGAPALAAESGSSDDDVDGFGGMD